MSPVVDPDAYTKAECITKSCFRDIYPAVDPSNKELAQTGKVSIITGGGRGLGVAIALAHAKAGVKGLVLAGRSILGLERTKEAILKESPTIDVLCVVTDISNEKSVTDLYAEVKSHFGTADTLINNAGVLTLPSDTIEKASSTLWWKDFEINVKGTFLVTAGFLRLIKETKPPAPTIVNLTSIVNAAPPSFSSYFTSKIAVVKFTEFIAAENPEVVAYSVSPGTCETDMTLDIFRPYAKDTPALTGAVLVYLAARRPEYLNGQHLVVNWDVEELELRNNELGNSDALKLRVLRPQSSD